MARGDEAHIRLPISVIKKLNTQVVGTRWLYIALSAHARELQQSIIPRPSGRSLARLSGLLSHPVEDYLKALVDAGLVKIKKESIEIVDIEKSNPKVKWSTEPIEVEKPKPKKAAKNKAKKKSSKKKKPDESYLAAKRSLDYFFDKHKELHGHEATIVQGKDIALLKRLLSKNDEETVKRLAVKFLQLKRTSDKMIEARGYTIAVFYDRFPGLLAAEKGAAPKPHQRSFAEISRTSDG